MTKSHIGRHRGAQLRCLDGQVNLITPKLGHIIAILIVIDHRQNVALLNHVRREGDHVGVGEHAVILVFIRKLVLVRYVGLEIAANAGEDDRQRLLFVLHVVNDHVPHPALLHLKRLRFESVDVDDLIQLALVIQPRVDAR